jgi:hypothetical protein
LKLCKKYFKKKEKPKRGKPKIYADYFILFIAVIMQMYKYSFREAVTILERELKKKMPAISTLHYRLSKLDKKILEEAILCQVQSRNTPICKVKVHQLVT